MIYMDTELNACDTAIAGIAAVELSALTRDALGVATVRVQGMIDRLTLAHARIVTEADRAGVWAGSGARGMADWLAQQSKTSYGDAADRVKLGDAADASPELAEAVASGELSAKSALALHSAVKEAPPGADVAGLVNAVKGATPREAGAAGETFREVNQPRPETPEETEDRRYRKRSVRSGQPDDGLVTTTVVLPVLAHRTFINAISHVAGKPSEGDERTNDQRLADGLLLLCDAYANGEVNGGRERPTILLVIDADTMAGKSEYIDPSLVGYAATQALALLPRNFCLRARSLPGRWTLSFRSRPVLGGLVKQLQVGGPPGRQARGPQGRPRRSSQRSK